MTGRSIEEIRRDYDNCNWTSAGSMVHVYELETRLLADVPGLLDRITVLEACCESEAGARAEAEAERDHWRFKARTLTEWKDEAADVLARALGYPSARENRTIPLGAVISLETAKQAAAVITGLRAQVEAVQALCDHVENVVSPPLSRRLIDGGIMPASVRVDAVRAAVAGPHLTEPKKTQHVHERDPVLNLCDCEIPFLSGPEGATP